MEQVIMYLEYEINEFRQMMNMSNMPLHDKNKYFEHRQWVNKTENKIKEFQQAIKILNEHRQSN